ncbi:ubiquitin-conjugating enzyme E2 S [Aphanomyces cochlioides]|nr:ubiquitin-conjugating enzyme E2 S [Aphanomyces cochlioides]
MSARENFPPQILQRVAKEIRQLVTKPPTGIRYLPQEEESLAEIHVELVGPEDTPYAGGFFEMKLVLTDGFPTVPPKGLFLTKIFHPNVATNGDICVNTLKRDWKADLDLSHVLQVIRCLLIVPFPESSLNDEAGKLFMESYDEYASRARILTSIHASKPKFDSKGHGTTKTDTSSSGTQSSTSNLNHKRPRVDVADEVTVVKKKHAVKKSLKRL